MEQNNFNFKTIFTATTITITITIAILIGILSITIYVANNKIDTADGHIREIIKQNQENIKLSLSIDVNKTLDNFKKEYQKEISIIKNNQKNNQQQVLNSLRSTNQVLENLIQQSKKNP